MTSKEKFLRAAKDGNLRLVKQYIEDGLDIDTKDNNGYTALMHASVNGCTEVVKYFIKMGVDIDIQNRYGWTALILASWNGYTEVAEYIKNSNEILLRKKLDIENASDVIKDSCIF